ncbi:unnamed protein product [Wuchereria bancrofti]|uniref:Uncharacterized protein n=1 Tax=Wuchereria bancrofti TaxID=6293 RepID=A0A3P7EEK5_WUCBA|nr:unnamed protein product [Wuchereria bancrofti]
MAIIEINEKMSISTMPLQNFRHLMKYKKRMNWVNEGRVA